MHGLSTLNRLLGKKNKEASRSTTNLSSSTSTLDTSSQHNRISPIVSNAPFEQTFRVTVYLPKNQLYVERIGAKTKLATLLEKIGENKHLTIDKYELRHPGDMSQVFDNEKTIGEVGLNELKLVLKSESRFNSDFHRFHPDDVIKYKTESVSSSEISRNYSNNNNKLQKASPYSSTTSLNSLDSTGMNLTAKTQPPVAPARKKRAAPRPPSQNSIPEQEIFGTTLNVFKEPHSILPKKNFHVSSPQLFQKSDKNNNNIETSRLNAITRPTSLYTEDRQRSPSEEVQQIMRERRDSNSLEKKKKPAPIPPKRTHKPVPSPRTVQDDMTIKEIDEQEVAAKADANVSKTMLNNPQPPAEEHPSIETTASDGPISIQIISSDNSIEPVDSTSKQLPATVSKVHIKTEEERRSSSEDEMTVNIYNVTRSVVTKNVSELREQKIVEEVSVKQNSELEKLKEAVKELNMESVVKVEEHLVQETYNEPTEEMKIVKQDTTVVQSYTPEAPKEIAPVVKEEIIATAVVASPEPQKIEQSSTSPNQEQLPAPVASPEAPEKPVVIEEKIQVVEVKPAQQVQVTTVAELQQPKEEVIIPSPPPVDDRPTSPLWTYTLPAPPVFADSSVVDKTSPTDNQKSGDKFFSDFASTDCNETVLSDSNTTVISAETHIQPIIVDRKSLDDSFAKTIVDDDSDKSTEIITSDLEDGYLGNGNVVSSTTTMVKQEIVIEDFKKSRLIITRSDSFHSIGQGRSFDNGLRRGPLSAPQRSTSFLSLQSQKAENFSSKSDNAPYSRQKSTSELSISDVPSLQSLEVIKNILNSSRKNSLQDAVVVTTPEVVKQPERQLSEPVVKKEVTPPPVETQWRYSGPPKINLSTWSERPKVEVAIAADSDYKFGGVKALSREFKKQEEQIVVVKPSVPNKRHTIHIPEAEKHLPKVLGVEYKKDVSPQAEIVTKPTRTIINIKPRPMSMDSNNTYSTLVTSTATPSSVSYNRLNNNVKKFTPVVRGFKLNNINEGDKLVESVTVTTPVSPVTPVPPTTISVTVPVVQKKSVEPPHVPAKPSYLRSSSGSDINRKMKFEVKNGNEGNDVVDKPFSQTTLRRTGLKDKILLNDKETKSIFGKVIETEPRVESVQLRHQENHVASRQSSVPAPPKPPTAPPPMNFRKSAPVSADTRDQLLDAIKNFNRDSLRHK